MFFRVCFFFVFFVLMTVMSLFPSRSFRGKSEVFDQERKSILRSLLLSLFLSL